MQIKKLRTAWIAIALVSMAVQAQNLFVMEDNKFALPALNYAVDALEPTISKETIDLHWGKHLAAYINNVNTLKEGTPFEYATLETMIKEADGGLFNNAAQVWNHKFYFDTFSPSGKRIPTGALADAIVASFGSFESFQKQFEQMGATLFGSGWVWLSKDDKGNLVITQEGNAGNPLRSGLTPLLVMDVWEHAYYVDYQNRRPEHLNKLWDIIDWRVVEERF